MGSYSTNLNVTSTFSTDFAIIQNDNSYTKMTGDDTRAIISLTNSFIFNDIYYNTVYLTSNGILGFNATASITIPSPDSTTASNIIGLFLPWADFNTVSPKFIYYKEDIENKTFTVLFDTIFYNTQYVMQFEAILYLDGHPNSRNVVLNFGNVNNSSFTRTALGFSFGSGNTSNLLTNVNYAMPNSFNPSLSPYVSITNNQSFYSNKQMIIAYSPLPAPTITNFSIPTKTLEDSPFTITQPTSNSTGSFSYTSSNTSVATISGNTITIVGVGTTTITATQTSTTEYNFGTISTTFQVILETPTITNFSIPTKTLGDSPFTITQPTSNSTGSFSYTSSNTSVATISGNTITIVGVGTTTITATQAATINYVSGTISTIFQVYQSTPSNPVNVDSSDELLYFMTTSSKYVNIENSMTIDYNLFASTFKVLTSNNDVKIAKNNN